MEQIDFVITWVDGSDPTWIKKKEHYSFQENMHTDSQIQRYRDWENLVYWFRGVEKFAPWVHRIHFVSDGQIPSWLNTNHPKLHIVNHSDYIPKKYLPIFSSHPIELNLHRIQGLVENFVFFNDDMFITAPVRENDFFRNGFPCDSAVLNVHCNSADDITALIAIRDIGIINKYFSLRNAVLSHPFKWINLKYGNKLLRTLVLLPCPRFPGMWQHHLPTSFKKSTFEEVWDLEYSELDETCTHRFRNMIDYNQWLLKEWQIAKGEFFPRSPKIGKHYTPVAEEALDVNAICQSITKKKFKMICIGDVEMSDEIFEKDKQIINEAFQTILPNKCSFEK